MTKRYWGTGSLRRVSYDRGRSIVAAGSNLKNVTPVPPPRRKKTNRGRPLPPKPDEIPEDVTTNLSHGDTSEEPLHLSVKPPRTTSGDDRNGDVETRGSAKISAEDAKHEGRRAREVYEHKASHPAGSEIPHATDNGEHALQIMIMKLGNKRSDEIFIRRSTQNELFTFHSVILSVILSNNWGKRDTPLRIIINPNPCIGVRRTHA